MATPIPESDADLVLLALEGRQDAFSALYERYFPSVFDFLTRLLRSRDEAADVAQDTFIKALEQLATLKKPERFKSWLFTTLHREFLGSRRRLTKFPHIDMKNAEPELPNIAPDVVDKLDAGIVMDALQQVDDKFRSALSLFYLKDHSYKEIPAVLNIPIGTVMSRISRGKSQLRDVLAQAVTATPSP